MWKSLFHHLPICLSFRFEIMQQHYCNFVSYRSSNVSIDYLRRSSRFLQKYQVCYMRRWRAFKFWTKNPKVLQKSAANRLVVLQKLLAENYDERWRFKKLCLLSPFKYHFSDVIGHLHIATKKHCFIQWCMESLTLSKWEKCNYWITQLWYFWQMDFDGLCLNWSWMYKRWGWLAVYVIVISL